MEEGEEPLVGMQRELLEETGMTGTFHLRLTFRKDPDGVVQDESFYIITHAEKVQEPHLEPGEKLEPASFSFEEFLHLILEPRFRHVSFANYLLRQYVLSGKQEELKTILFGS